MTQAFKIILGWFLLVMSSPIIVATGENKFTETGWMAIGDYRFDLFDGYLRSLKYYIFTIPIVLSIAFAQPGKIDSKIKSMVVLHSIPIWPILAMMMISIIAFVFDLGITGVETPTAWHLSGIVHYIRTYLFLGIITFYVFFDTKDRSKLILIYTFITGLTSGSRFVAVAPFMLMILKNISQPYSKSSTSNLLLLIYLFAGFTMVTMERLILFADEYQFKNIINIYKNTYFSLSEAFAQGVIQLFLRIGIGRDVILAHQVQESNVSLSLFHILFNAGGDPDSAWYFYGFVNDSTRFAIAVPALSNVYVSLNSFINTITILPAYCLWAHFLCKSPMLFNKIPWLNKTTQAGYLFQLIFVTIGPVSFALIIPVIGFIARVIYHDQTKGKLFGRGTANP